MRGAQARNILSIWVGRRVVMLSSERINQKTARVHEKMNHYFYICIDKFGNAARYFLKKALSPQEVYFVQSHVLFLRE